MNTIKNHFVNWGTLKRNKFERNDKFGFAHARLEMSLGQSYEMNVYIHSIFIY